MWRTGDCNTCVLKARNSRLRTDVEIVVFAASIIWCIPGSTDDRCEGDACNEGQVQLH